MNCLPWKHNRDFCRRRSSFILEGSREAYLSTLRTGLVHVEKGQDDLFVVQTSEKAFSECAILSSRKGPGEAHSYLIDEFFANVPG